MRNTFVTAIVSALAVLVMVGGFLALDRAVLHWYVPDSEDESIFTEAEARRAVVPLVPDGFKYPEGAVPRIVDCPTARFESRLEYWIVTCTFTQARGANPPTKGIFLLVDGTSVILK